MNKLYLRHDIDIEATRPIPGSSMKTIIQHYDKDYYRGHYGAFLDDEKYVNGVTNFYRHAIFNDLGLDSNQRILDFGSGPGQLTLGVGADCYDPSDFIQDYLREKNEKFLLSRIYNMRNSKLIL